MAKKVKSKTTKLYLDNTDKIAIVEMINKSAGFQILLHSGREDKLKTEIKSKIIYSELDAIEKYDKVILEYNNKGYFIK